MEELDVEILDAEAAAAHVAEWGRLAADCLEPNGFLEPGFALPAARHLAKHRRRISSSCGTAAADCWAFARLSGRAAFRPESGRMSKRRSALRCSTASAPRKRSRRSLHFVESIGQRWWGSCFRRFRKTGPPRGF